MDLDTAAQFLQGNSKAMGITSNQLHFLKHDPEAQRMVAEALEGKIPRARRLGGRVTFQSTREINSATHMRLRGKLEGRKQKKIRAAEKEVEVGAEEVEIKEEEVEIKEEEVEIKEEEVEIKEEEVEVEGKKVGGSIPNSLVASVERGKKLLRRPLHYLFTGVSTQKDVSTMMLALVHLDIWRQMEAGGPIANRVAVAILGEAREAGEAGETRETRAKAKKDKLARYLQHLCASKGHKTPEKAALCVGTIFNLALPLWKVAMRHHTF